jgi:hypothetical protein
MQEAGRLILILGVVLVVAGGVLMALGRLHPLGGPLAGLTFRAGGVTVYIPIVASLILSVILTLILNIVLRQR